MKSKVNKLNSVRKLEKMFRKFERKGFSEELLHQLAEDIMELMRNETQFAIFVDYEAMCIKLIEA